MQIAYVNVFVSNLANSVQFYESVLGLPLQFSSADHGYASFEAGSVRLGIAVPGPDEAHLIGRHTGVGFDVEKLQETYDHLSSLGVHFNMPPTKQPWGGFMALFADPDQNVFYLDQTSVMHSE